MDQRHRRRLSTICSHLHPHCPFPHQRPGSLHPSAVSSDNRAQDKPCVFCSISRGESEAFKLYEDDMCVCILDSNPLTHGHSLIITKSHYPSLDATPALVVAAMCSKVPFLSNAIMKATQSGSLIARGMQIHSTCWLTVDQLQDKLISTSFLVNQETSCGLQRIREGDP
ncbi:adenylylsulfatase HINT3 isoform X5 [Asparagus officinalis]|uniref:adenylylsulfatase HINT3 isoform X5 n=1 Tax=Asparagus officinalis TaxID=4686 RepID=UPI00098E2EFE|nr:adenylylsulfatase HINT3 isoform X5 [Asparagus officinalis]